MIAELEAEYQRLWELCQRLQSERQTLYFTLYNEEVLRAGKERGAIVEGNQVMLPEGFTKKDLDALKKKCSQAAVKRPEYRKKEKEENQAHAEYMQAQKRYFDNL